MTQQQTVCVCNSLRMVTRAVTQLYDETLRPSGLRVTQFSILGLIARLGAANVTQLTQVLEIDQTTLTRSLKTLESDELIERVAQADARVKVVRLTAKGKQAVRAAYPLWKDAQQRVLRQIGAKAWADIQGLLASVPGIKSVSPARKSSGKAVSARRAHAHDGQQGTGRKYGSQAR